MISQHPSSKHKNQQGHNLSIVIFIYIYIYFFIISCCETSKFPQVTLSRSIWDKPIDLNSINLDLSRFCLLRRFSASYPYSHVLFCGSNTMKEKNGMCINMPTKQRLIFWFFVTIPGRQPVTLNKCWLPTFNNVVLHITVSATFYLYLITCPVLTAI